MISSDFNNVMEKIRVHLKNKHDKKIYDADIAKALGISKEHYSRSKRNSKIPLESIIEFCAKESIVINYILFDQIPDSLEKATDNLISIKYFKNINSSAGGGALNYEDDFEKLYLDDEIVNELGGKSNLKNIEAINVLGDSMEPIIKDKSIIYLDRSKTNIEDEEIYVINASQGVLVKRLKVRKYNYIDLISDNNQYSHERVLKSEIDVIGKVVGISEGLL